MIREIHAESRGSYGSPRVHAELVLGLGVQVNRKRVERLMRTAGLQGIYRRRRGVTTIRNPADQAAGDLVNRAFTADRPNRLWLADIERHEALANRAVVKGHRPRPVAVGRVKQRAA